MQPLKKVDNAIFHAALGLSLAMYQDKLFNE